MTIIGKSKAALAMICDALNEQVTDYVILLYNNLGIEGELKHEGFNVVEVDKLDEDDYILGAVMPGTKRKIVEAFNLPYRKLMNQASFISVNAEIGEGTIVDALVSVASGAKIGQYVTLYQNCSVAHDCVVEDFVTICPNVALCGDVHVGEGTFVGAGSVVKNGIKIGKNALVGCGSVVVKNVKDGETVYGNPAK